MLDGAKVKAARLALGLTGRAFAKLLGVSPSTVTKIEDNDYPATKLELAERAAWILRVPLCTLLKAASPPHAHGTGGEPHAPQ